jgi:hypothetical protein
MRDTEEAVVVVTVKDRFGREEAAVEMNWGDC